MTKLALSSIYILLAWTFNSQAQHPCSSKLKAFNQELKDMENYGIERDGVRVLSPKKCTPLMALQKMIPLPKRHAGGIFRERYFGADCRIYEWDYQHGAFEVYSSNSNVTQFYHEGEISAVTMVKNTSKRDQNRNHLAGDTGIPGYDMKKLCGEHSKGKFKVSQFEKNSKVKNSLKCF